MPGSNEIKDMDSGMRRNDDQFSGSLGALVLRNGRIFRA